MKDKNKTYNRVAYILENYKEARESNKTVIRLYYMLEGMTLDEAFRRNDVVNYQTIERMARQIKATNPKYKVDKSEQEAEYKQIALETPVVVKLL